MTSKEEAALTPETKAERIRGSKWVLVSEQAMVMSVWSCKAIMLIAYRTITHATPDSPSQSHEYTADPFRSGLKRERWINAIAVYVVCGWLATEITYFSACRPFSGYWSVPAISTQC